MPDDLPIDAVQLEGMRTPKGKLKVLVFVLSLALVAFQLRAGLVGVFADMIQGAIHVGFVLVLCFIFYRGATGSLWRIRYGNDLILFVLGGASGTLLLAISLELVKSLTGAAFLIPGLAWYLIGIAIAAVLYVPVSYLAKRDAILPVDIILMLLAIIVSAYTLANYDRIVTFAATATTLDYLIATSLLLLVFEAGRRVIGWALIIVSASFVFYALWGQYIPGFWGHPGMSVQTLLYSLYMTSTGLFGQITAISASVVALFLIYGAFLESSGSAKSFENVAISLVGKSRGGPPKVSVIASSLFGMISGSSSANVGVTGNFTIPLMKGVGYKSEFAAGTEATASTGGQIMPPIMGIVAFLMAELLGISYLKVVIAAIIPAASYYVSVFFMVHFMAGRGNFPTVPSSQIPRFRDALEWRHIIPVFASISTLLILLVQGYSITRCIFGSLVVVIILYLAIGGHPRQLLPRSIDIIRGFETGARNIIPIATVIILAQLVVSLVGITGIGVKMATTIVSLQAGGGLLAASVLAAVVTLVLGMGMPTPAAYLIGVGVVVPALITAGLQPIVAHMFVFYYAVMSSITPPVCSAVYIASSLARCSWVKASRYACLLGYVGLTVPIVFAFRPTLLMIGAPLSILWDTLMLFMGIIFIASGVTGFLMRSLNIVERVIFVVGGVLVFVPSAAADIVGILLIVVAILWQRFYKRGIAPTEAGGIHLQKKKEV